MRSRYRTNKIAQFMSKLSTHSMCDTTYVLQQDADIPRWPMLDTHPNRQCESEFPVRRNTL